MTYHVKQTKTKINMQGLHRHIIRGEYVCLWVSINGGKCSGMGAQKKRDTGGKNRSKTVTNGNVWPGKFPQKYIHNEGMYADTYMVVDAHEWVRLSVLGSMDEDGRKNSTRRGLKCRSWTQITPHRTSKFLVCLYGRKMGTAGEVKSVKWIFCVREEALTRHVWYVVVIVVCMMVDTHMPTT